MVTAIGADTLTSLSRQYTIPKIVDHTFGRNGVMYRLLAGNKVVVQGGTQIEQPGILSQPTAGGWYSGYGLLDTTPFDVIKNPVWDWKQCSVPITISTRDLAKANSPEAVANLLQVQTKLAEMRMAELLASGIWSLGTDPLQPDGFRLAIDSTGTYAGLARATYTGWASQEDGSTTALSMTALNTMFTNLTLGGNHPTLIASQKTPYNLFWALNEADRVVQIGPSGHDEILASAGFTNQLFNNVPWLIDDHVPDANSIFMFNEEFIDLIVNPLGDFIVEDFAKPTNQNAFVSHIHFMGNIIVEAPRLQGKFTAITS
jgi:hypothetical protein